VSALLHSNSLGGFVLRVAAWLAPAFLVWYAAAGIFAWPIVLLTDAAARIAFSDIVRNVEQQGYLITIVSTLKPALATTQNPGDGLVSVELNTLLYSFGFPMLAALTLAARQRHALRTLAIGYAVLAPFVTWGIIAEFLKRIAFDTATTVAVQAGFGPLQREAIAFAYQFGSLILPTVAPAVFWVLAHRRFLEGLTASHARALSQ
jgi:hypothetical protein